MSRHSIWEAGFCRVVRPTGSFRSQLSARQTSFLITRMPSSRSAYSEAPRAPRCRRFAGPPHHLRSSHRRRAPTHSRPRRSPHRCRRRAAIHSIGTNRTPRSSSRALSLAHRLHTFTFPRRAAPVRSTGRQPARPARSRRCRRPHRRARPPTSCARGPRTRQLPVPRPARAMTRLWPFEDRLSSPLADLGNLRIAPRDRLCIS
jgi:hypothetical protein